MSNNGESPRLLTPEQIRVGTKEIMTHAEHRAFLINSGIADLLGFSHWRTIQQNDIQQQQSSDRFVINLSIEKWVGNRNEGDLIDTPNWIQIEAAIRELDGESKTLVTLSANEQIYMRIRGGASGKYFVSVTFDNLNFYTLVDLSKSDETEKLVVGGQQGIYPEKMCVDLLHCLLAARTFTESGKLDLLLSWEEEKSSVAA